MRHTSILKSPRVDGPFIRSLFIFMEEYILLSQGVLDVARLSDQELLHRCEQYGREALVWRNKFRALLPEVERRKLYLKKGYPSIFVFGKILAGLSEEQVSESLNIMPRLRDKPSLKKLLESGEVSVSKITRVMSIATKENECELAEMVQLLSLGALKTFVHGVRQEIRQESSKAEFLVDQKLESESLFAQEGEDVAMLEIFLPRDIVEKIEELRRRGIDVEIMMREMFAAREQEIAQKKDEVAQSLPEESSRYIPARVKHILTEEYGTKCAIRGCNKPSEETHHTARYALTKSHDPNYLALLCKEHHEIAHAIDAKVVEKRMGGP